MEKQSRSTVLDPYAADVCWETLSAVVATEAIDVWRLLPFSTANRLMKKTGEIDPTWREKLNSILGDSSWEVQLYEESPQMDFFNKVKSYEEWTPPQIVENAIELFEKELPRYRDKIQMLHLCFTTDPFIQGHPEICQLSMEILRKVNAAGVKCSILTKGILPAQLTELPLENEYGITAVSLSDTFNQQYEPGAASISNRIAALRHLSEYSCKTWVSIEPYPTLNMITQNLCDAYLNHIGYKKG